MLDVGRLDEQSIAHASFGSLLSDLGTLVNNPDMFPDVTFTVSGEPVYAHKVRLAGTPPSEAAPSTLHAILCSLQAILSARSAHFRAMFASGFRESRASSSSRRHSGHEGGRSGASGGDPEAVDFGDQWSSGAFVVLLEFLYTGNVHVPLSGPLAEEVMSLSQYTGAEGLKAICETTLIHTTDTATVCSLISTAHRCQVRAWMGSFSVHMTPYQHTFYHFRRLS